MKTIVYNDLSAAKEAAEIEALRAQPTADEAEEFIKRMDPYELGPHLPRGTWAGKISFPRRGEFAFVGDIYVPPPLAREWKGEPAAVAVHAVRGRRGLAADRIVALREYVSWHHDEIVGSVLAEMAKRRASEWSWRSKASPVEVWERKKAAVKTLGLTLREIRECVRRETYGGAGTDTYLFNEEAVSIDLAQKVLDVLHGRHALKEPVGPTEPGHDRITLVDGGFTNDWCGPWTD